MPCKLLNIVVFTYLVCPTTLYAESVTITDKEQTDLAVTLYTDNLGLIQDTRILPRLKKDDTVVILDVSQQMQTETLNIKNAGTIKEQTLNNSLLSYNALLLHYIGKDVILAHSQPSGQEIQQTVQLLNVEGNTALIDNNGRIESIPLSSDWRLIFPSRPDNMLLKPSLTFRSEGTDHAGTARLSYLTQGLSWQMDYVMTLNEDNTSLAVDGLASLMNNTGASLKDARIRLLAGDVYRDNNPRYRAKTLMMAQALTEDARSPLPETLNDYQLYSLDEPITLHNQQRTQVPLLHEDKVAIKSLQRHQFYINANVDNQTYKVKPESFIRFTNDKQHGLGSPLPAGQARFFSPDNAGELHYVGSAQINQTAAGEQVELSMGKAFEVTITQRQTDFQPAFDGTVAAYELRIRNSAMKPRDVEISSLFSHPWKLISSTLQPTEKTAGMAKWQVSVPGNSESLLTMRVRLIKQ
ncbi:DUF4139 domain-containing protein [Neptunomonas antarctica]|uniref:DUF4139 domain-containing protein n=1 Tax=Neptunomonas antarctica TaxID=619304 RepID=A0A1N7NM46_9GAMM|nr:hypothetical protein [Neptunomonas antarctica]SIS99361.1 hypothetical protein SAMN05421760_11046 [Neptunomonas antarctica]